ncbi:sulfurtransferase TusA family protein [Cysteiniphilum halobium]|uniref:sulfurtransferase TusA family protein n=1 Tax=Cysteiniphilum halobium TaxID=2219059 RepID=UPI000E650457|nr:sulfurtransferase TusA family protein [Cysteiniphilum halobium]
MEINLELDLRRLLCPMPVIKTQNALKKMGKGEHLKVICTDPGVKHDIPAWCKINGYDILEQFNIDNEFIFVIKA